MQINIKSLYIEHAPKLIYYTRKYLPFDIQKAEEIVSDVFVSLGKYSFKTEPQLRDWLYTCVRNKCLDHIRDLKKRKVYYGEVMDIGDNDNNDNEIMAEVVSNIMKLIESLSKREKQVIKLSYFEGLKNQEIASSLGISINTVKRFKDRALSKLKMDLGLKEDTRPVSMRDRIRELWHNGYSTIQMSALLNIRINCIESHIWHIKQHNKKAP